MNAGRAGTFCIHCGREFEKRQVHQLYCSNICRRKRYNRLKRYGLTDAEFDVIKASQGGVCAICGGPPNGQGLDYHVDHDHDTGKVRGLLCMHCNNGLGHFQDRIDVLEKAVEYLKRASGE